MMLALFQGVEAARAPKAHGAVVITTITHTQVMNATTRIVKCAFTSARVGFASAAFIFNFLL